MNESYREFSRHAHSLAARDDTCGENCSPQKPQCGRGRERKGEMLLRLYLLKPENSRVMRGYIRDAETA